MLCVSYSQVFFFFLLLIICPFLKVLAVTEGVHDVHSIAKEATALHSSLMEDLSKVFLYSHLFVFLPFIFIWIGVER